MNNQDTIDLLADVTLCAEKVMKDLDEYGGTIVPHLIDNDENDGQRLRNAIRVANGFMYKHNNPAKRGSFQDRIKRAWRVWVYLTEWMPKGWDPSDMTKAFWEGK